MSIEPIASTPSPIVVSNSKESEFSDTATPSDRLLLWLSGLLFFARR